MHYESHQHHHQHLHQHQHQHFHSNGTPVITPQAPQSVVSSCLCEMIAVILAPVVQKVDSTIHRINPYSLDSAISFHNTYPLDSDLSGG